MSDLASHSATYADIENWLVTHTFDGREIVSAPSFDAISFDMDLLWPFDPPRGADPTPKLAENR